uniref:Oxysterol-binding protein n=1 Tax=Trichobilharzia regenti TaxID=157069 RepID=A0AA85KAI4_TRIRE|nr:unnamed protein product [Trichobilharzia regenti]
MDNSFTMEGPLSKWTNLVNGWQYRWFVLDISLGVLSYYTSKEKMMRGDRRGCVKLKNAQVGIDDEDDSTFTITVDHKTFHFQARDSDERQKWLDALQEARDLHTQNYALLNQTNRLLEHPCCLSEFDRRIVEADAYLQILIDQHEQLVSHLPSSDECRPEIVGAVTLRMQRLIELVKKTIVCLQFARGTVTASYRIPINSSDAFISDGVDVQRSIHFDQFAASNCGSSLRKKDYDLKAPTTHQTFAYSRSGEGDGENTFLTCQESLYGASPVMPKPPSRKHSARNSRRLEKGKIHKRPSSTTESSIECTSISSNVENQTAISSSLPTGGIIIKGNFDILDSPSLNYQPLSISRMPVRSYSSSDDDRAPLDQEEDDEEFFDTQEDISATCTLSNSPHPMKDSTNMNTNIHSNPIAPVTKTGRYRVSQSSANNQSDLSSDDVFDELYDDENEEELGSVQSHGSVITHLLSQLRIGMDLTRITLPTFILERRSTLEMYADFLAHADLWAVIPDAPTPRDRMVACLRWYLSAFHAGRRSSVAKKPYNPTLGEIFRCYWPVSIESGKESTTSSGNQRTDLCHSGPVPWAPVDSVVFLAEQVSHHPPISAFYAEHVNKRIAVDGHLWTKSKFLGLSIAVEMVGSAVISLLSHDEEYVVTFPCGYGRNILTVPWIELGGKTSIICSKTGYVANIEFRTKPFYGGKKDSLRAEVFGPNDKKPFLTVEGEWNDKMWAKWSHGRNELFIDTRSLPTVKKHVLPRSRQAENESRRLWEEVTYNLKVGNIDAATDAKHRLEQRQRDLARMRRDSKNTWTPEHFRGEGENWIYRHPLIQRLNQSPNKSNVTESQNVISNLLSRSDKSVNMLPCDKPSTDFPQLSRATTSKILESTAEQSLK